MLHRVQHVVTDHMMQTFASTDDGLKRHVLSEMARQMSHEILNFHKGKVSRTGFLTTPETMFSLELHTFTPEELQGYLQYHVEQALKKVKL